MTFKCIDQNFRIILLNRNSGGTVKLQLVLSTGNFISVGALPVCVIVTLHRIFCLMDGRN